MEFREIDKKMSYDSLKKRSSLSDFKEKYEILSQLIDSLRKGGVPLCNIADFYLKAQGN